MAITFELTRDPELLAQYYALRERCFRVDLDLPDFDGSEDLLDKRGRILVAHEDGVCIGGARISSSWAIASDSLDADLADQHCCVWERFVIDPSIRSLQFTQEFCVNLVEFSRVLGYSHALVLSSLRNARHYRRCHAAMDVKFQIRKSVPDCAKGKFAGLEHYLSVAHLNETTASEKRPPSIARAA